MVLARRRPAGAATTEDEMGSTLDFRLGDVERVAHGDEVARALARHDAGDARACGDIALLARSSSTMALGFRCMRMVPSAIAMRLVICLSPTSTMRTSPCSSTCVRSSR